MLGLNPQMTSIRCMLRFAHSPLNITKNNYRVCICGEMETELLLFFHCNVHCAARTALHNKVHDILNETGFAERFERLGHTDLLRVKGVRKGGLRLTPPLSLIFYKTFITRRVCRVWFFTKIRGVCVEEYAYFVNKLRLKTWIWRQIVTSQTAHTKYKWPLSATEWNPSMNIFCVRHCCEYIYMVCLMRRLPFQYLFLTLLVNFWNVVIDSSKTVYSFLRIICVCFLEFTCAVF